MYWWLRGYHAHGLPARPRRRWPARAAPRRPPRARSWPRPRWRSRPDDVPGRSGPLARAADAHAGDDVRREGQSPSLVIGLAHLATGDLAAAGRLLRASRSVRRGGRRRRGVDLTPSRTSGSARSPCWAAIPDGAAADAIEPRPWARPAARGDRLTAYIALYNLSQVELTPHRPSRTPRSHLEEGIRLSLETGDLANLAHLLDAAGVLKPPTGGHARVPLLLGAAQGIRESTGAPRLRLLPARPRSGSRPAESEARRSSRQRPLRRRARRRAGDAARGGRGAGARGAPLGRLTRPAHHPYTSHCPRGGDASPVRG